MSGDWTQVQLWRILLVFAVVGSGWADSISTQINGDRFKVEISREGHLTIEGQGELVFSPDDQAIISMEPESWLKFKEEYGRKRQLEISPDAAGKPIYRWSVNGVEVPFDKEGKGWLAQSLLVLFRSTSINAPQRVARLFAKSGLKGVLAELSQITSDYTASVYYRELLGQKGITPTEQLKAVASAGKQIDSDRRLAQFLAWAARTYFLSSADMIVFFDAATHISSDREMANLLKDWLAHSKLEQASLIRGLEVAQAISSDIELARLLIHVVEAQPEGRPLPEILLRSLCHISSDREHARVLQAIFRRGHLSAAQEEQLLVGARQISSDRELGQILEQLAREYRPDQQAPVAYFHTMSKSDSDQQVKLVHRQEAQQPRGQALPVAFYKTAATIGSDRELSKVLTAVALGRPLLSDAFYKAAATINSDRELSRVLQVVASNFSAEQGLPAGFFKAAGSIGSDGDLGHCLAAIFARPQVGTGTTIGALNTAMSMDSDRQLAKLLIQISQHRPQGEVLTAYKVAAGRIDSWRERERALAALDQN